jgi:octaprenyl-diphosphate synthase
MNRPLEVAVGSLSTTASARVQDPRLGARLADIQALLGDSMTEVERGLSESGTRGPAPGRTAAAHLLGLGGKRIRPLALLASASCFGPVPPAAIEMAVVAELIHSATLLHDDVLDDGMERRGAPAARRVWGNAVSVLGGDLLLVDALQRAERHAPEVLPTLLGTLRQLVDGEITQLAGRRTLDPSREVYDRILVGKTASLFGWATRTGARLGGASADEQDRFAAFGELLGMAFQLVDDTLDYASDATEKTCLADLREGKLTLPLVLALERDPGLMEPVLAVHAGRDAPLEEIRGRVLESGACEEVRALSDEYTARAIQVLQQSAPSRGRDLLEAIAIELSRRSR